MTAPNTALEERLRDAWRDFYGHALADSPGAVELSSLAIFDLLRTAARIGAEDTAAFYLNSLKYDQAECDAHCDAARAEAYESAARQADALAKIGKHPIEIADAIRARAAERKP